MGGGRWEGWERYTKGNFSIIPLGVPVTLFHESWREAFGFFVKKQLENQCKLHLFTNSVTVTQVQ